MTAGDRVTAMAAMRPDIDYFWSYEGLLAVALLCLAEGILIGILLIEWRRRQRAERSLAERLKFEALLADLHAEFVTIGTAEIDAHLGRALARVSESLGVDKGGLLDYARRDQGVFHQLRWARREDIPIPLSDSPLNYPWALARLLQGKTNRFTRPEELPPEAAIDRQSYERIGTLSHVAIPLVLDGAVLGAMFFATVDQPRAWPDELVQRLELLGRVFAFVLARKRADAALRESRELSAAIVESLPDKVIVIDGGGAIIASNEHGAPDAHAREEHIGVNYLDLWRRASERHPAARKIERGVDAVLRGEAAQFAAEFQWGDEVPQRWFDLRVRPLRGAAGGAVIVRIDVTERKRAEADARRIHEELARAGRLTTLGQLSAAIAHEVGQPLTAILSNAQAARRLMAAGVENLDEIRSIVEDIIADDRRAGDILQRLRGMMRRREPELATVDVTELIENVIRFLHSDAVIRNVEVTHSLEAGLPAVRGDVVQLQQVVVNLVMNGIEAMQAVPAGRRRLHVTAERTAAGVRVAVSDSGPGLAEATQARLFEPFHTTKPEGMGLGLTIARSIVDAHGGSMWADASAAAGGATFVFTLPHDGAVAANESGA